MTPAVALFKAFRDALAGVESFDDDGAAELVARTVPKYGLAVDKNSIDFSGDPIQPEEEQVGYPKDPNASIRTVSPGNTFPSVLGRFIVR